MSELFSTASTKKHLDALRDLPPEQGGIGVVVHKGQDRAGVDAAQGCDIGVQGAVNKDLGTPGGWSFAAAGSWMRKTGASAAAWLTWSGK